MERNPQRQAWKTPVEQIQQPAIVMPQAVQGGRREMAPQPGHPPEYRGRNPYTEDRQYSRPMPGAPRADNRPPQAMPLPGPQHERYRQAPPTMHEMQAPAAVQREQRASVHREPPHYREPPQSRQPSPERAAPVPREAPSQRPPAQADHNQHRQAPDDRRGDRGQR